MPLTVFKASAGSGKTFTLAIEYIKLLIQNPEAYRGILAVTFTNKATEEMKMRILSQLYGLWKQLPDSEDYMRSLSLSLSEREGTSEDVRAHISKQAGKALRLLLDNYHFFRVQTIDTFFQSVLRNLARELQLNPNMRVALNNQQVVEEAIDNLIDSISDDKELSRVVMGYVKERLENNESWNFIRGIKDFAGNIFKDFYKEHRDKLNDKAATKGFFDNYKRRLRTLADELEKKYQAIGDEACAMWEGAGLGIDDFCRKESGGIGYFTKMQKGRFAEIDMEKTYLRQAYDNPDSWATKTAKNREQVLHLVNEALYPLMHKTEMQRPLDVRMYNSVKKTLAHINDVQLLRHIEAFAKELNDSAQRFMLSDTPTLLGEMVKDDDSPFVFEKIGAHLEHIMIDEFQDTSTVQWQNFKKLLLECIGKGNSNLIVGDVKQSIYRWRSGDWRLLNSIDQQFSASLLDFKPLDTNYRSERNVINFNNTFFKTVSDLEVQAIMDDSPMMASQLKKAYQDVGQKVPAKKASKGLVHIDLIPKSQEDSMAERTLDIISTLVNGGAKMKDIAILLRSNREATALATFLDSQGIPVMSAEAFRLDASTSVRTVVGAMKHLAHPTDALTENLLLKDSGLTALPSGFAERRDHLLTLSLHDMAEEILRLFRLGGSEGAYLTTFFDKLHQYCNDVSTVLEDFLTAWDDDICSATIETPDCDGVRILTIHKSKGLEFKHVILPYCNWKLELRSTLWCQPKESPFDELPIVPLDYTSVSSFKNTIYFDDVMEEHVQNIVDNLNLLYVAMTRARRSLFVIGIRSDEKGNKTAGYRSNIIEQAVSLMPDSIEGLPLHVNISADYEEDITVTYGTLEGIFEEKEKEKSRNVFLPEITPIHVDVTSHESGAVFRQSNKSREFADDSLDETDRQRYIRMGTVMHQVFSQIATLDDVEPVLQRMEFDGTLYDDDMTHSTLIAELQKRFSNEQVREWFSDRWTLYNECSIITKEKEMRPDRVMTDGKETIVVDFKFGKPDAEHHEQVRAYMNLLKDMGMPDVKGFLWYVTRNEVSEVKS